MKDILKKSVFLLSFLILIVSCNEVGDDSIFDSSASERVTAAVNEFDNKLQSSNDGWIFEYYPDKTQQYGGYNYVVTFKDKKKVDVYSEIQTDFSSPETSTYDVIAVGGPVLTFDTYNSVMHFFANPSQDLYQARGGDYEFLLSSDSENNINAKGRVSGNNLKLIKLTETPQSYLTKVKATVDFLDGVSYFISLNNESVQVPVSNRNFTFSNPNSEDTKVAFIYTDKGVKLYKPTTIYGNEVSEFILDKDKKQLTSTDGSTTLEIVSPPFIIEQNWSINVAGAGEVSDKFFNTFLGVYNANTTSYAETLSANIRFGNTFASTPSGILFRSFSDPATGDGFWAEYNLTFAGVSGAPNQINIAKLAEGFNWRFYGHLDPMLNLIVDNAPYNVEATPSNDPTEVKLTSASDSNVWFIIRK